MKNLAILIGLVGAVIAWGLLGAAQAGKVGYTCKAEVGPMCFLWERSGVGKAQDAIGNIIDDATKSSSGKE